MRKEVKLFNEYVFHYSLANHLIISISIISMLLVLLVLVLVLV